MTGDTHGPCQLVISHEGALAALAVSVKNLASATEKVGMATEAMGKALTDMAQIDRDEYQENKGKIAELDRCIEAWQAEARGTLADVGKSLERSEKCIEELKQGVSHLGWLNRLIAYTASHPKVEKAIFLALGFLALQYLCEHAQSMWEFLLKVIRFTGWKPGL